MKTTTYSLLMALSLLTALFINYTSQAHLSTTQTVRGKITDATSKAPVVSATVVVIGSAPLNVTTTDTDTDGNFVCRAYLRAELR